MYAYILLVPYIISNNYGFEIHQSEYCWMYIAVPTQHRDNLFDPISIHIISRCPKFQFLATEDLRMCLS